jgi:hypothetical protein
MAAGECGGDPTAGRIDLVSLAVELGLGDWDFSGSELADDGIFEADGGIGG